MKHVVKKVINIQEINELIDISALTFEGLNTSEDNIKEVIDWLKELDAIKEDNKLIFHIISGKLMNKSFNLTGDNKYPDNLSIVSISGIDQSKVIIARFEVGGRWLDDIVDNNLNREQ